jgi:hypothetical protein
VSGREAVAATRRVVVHITLVSPVEDRKVFHSPASVVALSWRGNVCGYSRKLKIAEELLTIPEFERIGRTKSHIRLFTFVGGAVDNRDAARVLQPTTTTLTRKA